MKDEVSRLYRTTDKLTYNIQFEIQYICFKLVLYVSNLIAVINV